MPFEPDQRPPHVAILELMVDAGDLLGQAIAFGLIECQVEDADVVDLDPPGPSRSNRTRIESTEPAGRSSTCSMNRDQEAVSGRPPASPPIGAKR